MTGRGTAGRSRRAPWARRTLADLLAEHGLEDAVEEPFAHDGWSGASLTLLRRGGARFILKRTSWATDWIARSTRDHALREAVVAAEPAPLQAPLSSPYLGAAADGNAAAILMPDLGGELLAWDGAAAGSAVAPTTLDRVLAAAAALHSMPWLELRRTPSGLRWPWCPVRERIQLLSRDSARRYVAGGLAVGGRFLAGWDAFDRQASPAAADLVRRLSADPSTLLAALGRLPAMGLHGDLKLANCALRHDGSVALIDWQLTTLAPVAVELGWLLVSNAGQLPDPPEVAFECYVAALGPGDRGRILGEEAAQLDLAILVGLLLRGWRKGLDAEAGVLLPSGRSATEDLAWWCERAVEAARRRL